ncbi:UDP-glucose-4-epimerase [Naganishia cerealis]|uniref:UDP-glucose-4-epimerase n=1 Tax=Naganishia cerealis TaxID=610337 RepID=A0ACC2VE02_9TREE|nr:UDP-glucose-4-epimerase [Naganishia cerealis]
MSEYIVVTGGAGYIGSHTVVELIQHGYKVIIVDNLVNSSYDAVARIEYIVKQPIPFFNVDLQNYDELLKVFQSYNIKGVIHFAALKAVGESTQIPLEYYENNVGGTMSLLKVMKKVGVKTIVFSSSATVYGDATRFENMIPIPEHCPNDPTNPYGKTKYMIENILKDMQTADSSWRTAILRYFNPIGAHPSGLIGEDPLGIPNNLLPYLAQVAIGRREKLSVFGNDYKSHDGTPIRDYIHVVDLAKGHIAALNYMQQIEESKGLYREWNLGTGKGSTVFDVYNAFCKAVGRQLPYEVVGRRAGDVVDLTANPTRANTELKWKAELSIEDSCRDLWRWTTENPFGFQNDSYKWSLFQAKNDTSYLSRLHTVKFSETDFEVSIANYGALIQDIKKKGQSFVQGFSSLDGYKHPDNPFFGTSVGRVANRISNASFSIDGKSYSLTKNENGATCLHGGNNGFDKNYFLGPVVKNIKDKDGQAATTLDFVYVDKDGNDGFPADLVTYVKYTIDKVSVSVEFEASIAEDSKADATPVHLTNHSYFNVTNGPTINGTTVKAITNKYLEVDDKYYIPTGKVAEFPKELITGLQLGESSSFDNCLVVDQSNWKLDTRNEPLRPIFEASHENSKAAIKFYSTDPAFQFYTGDGVSLEGYENRCGFCIEPGRFTDAVNNAEWAKQVVLRKGEVYGSKLKYSFV